MNNKPLFKHITSLIKSNPSRFHTPGHKGRWGEFFHENTTGFDIFQSDIADDIDGIPGKIRESEENAAKIHKTKRSIFLVNGSTAGIHTMLLSLLKPGDQVLVSRNMHRSAIEGIILTGTIPRYVKCRLTQEGIPLNVTPGDVEKALNEFPQCKCVYITSPSYFGVTADIKKIAGVCEKYDRILLVDEAWGAHYPFHEDLPPSAITSGADMVVQSVHKTLPSLTGSSILHICSDKIDTDKVESAKSLVETSSPNLLFYLSLENAVAVMAENGKEILETAIQNATFCRERMRKSIEGIPFQFLSKEDFANKGSKGPLPLADNEAPFLMDPLKLTLWTNHRETGIAGIKIAQILEEEHGIYSEMSHLDAVQLLFTGYEREEDLNNLVESFEKVIKNYVLSSIRETVETVQVKIGNDVGNDSFDPGMNSGAILTPDFQLPTSLMPPRQAYFSNKKKINLWESVGSICGELVTPYPPGIPVLVPGEEITMEIVDYLMETLEAEGTVKGLDLTGEEVKISVVF